MKSIHLILTLIFLIKERAKAYENFAYQPYSTPNTLSIPFTYNLWPPFEPFLMYPNSIEYLKATYGFETLTDVKEKFEDIIGESTDRQGRVECPNFLAPKCDAHYRFRIPDGSCNNLNVTWWGQSNTIFKRLLQPAYQDLRDEPRSLGVDGRPLKSAREVANRIHYPSDLFKDITHYMPIFGQFVMHDLTRSSHTHGNDGEVKKCVCGSKDPDCLSIPIPKNDYHFSGQSCLIQIRERDGRPGFNCDLPYRSQINEINSWVDLSQVYGNSVEESSRLRAFYGGRLEVSYFKGAAGPMLPSSCPYNAFKLVKATNVCFDAGDNRVNQYPLLSGMHTLFVREHNRMADALGKINPHWDDERLYQETKRILSSVYQNIVYWEWLPLVIGEELHLIMDLEQSGQGEYFAEYDNGIFPNVAAEFTVAAARFGHTLFRPYVSRVNENYQPVYNESLREFMFRPDKLVQGEYLDEYMRGALVDMCDQNAPHVNDELSNFLIHDLGNNNPTQWFSLSTFNINRGREFGIPPYAFYRKFIGLDFPKSFDELSWISPKLITKLRSVYKNVLDADLFTGGFSEQHIKGGLVGPTIAFILARGFRDWKYADRFFYENPPNISPYAFTPNQLDAIRKMRLNSVICNTINVKDVTYNVFLKPDSAKNPFIPCSSVYQLDLNLFREPYSYTPSDTSQLYAFSETNPMAQPPAYYNEYYQYISKYGAVPVKNRK